MTVSIWDILNFVVSNYTDQKSKESIFLLHKLTIKNKNKNYEL